MTEEKIYDEPIVTQIESFTKFYSAEDYHQDYYNQNKEQPYCNLVITPKIEKFKMVFKDKIRVDGLWLLVFGWWIINLCQKFSRKIKRNIL